MNRRRFLRSTLISAAGVAVVNSRGTLAFDADEGWRTFELTTEVEVTQPAGRTRVWLPAPLAIDTPYQKTLGNAFHAPGGSVTLVKQPQLATDIVSAEWPDGVKPVLSLASRVSTRDYVVDVARPGSAARRAGGTEALERFLAP